MGTKRTYRCPTCAYKVLTSAGPDGGFRTSTETFVCNTCKTIHDLYIDRASKSEGHIKIRDGQGCQCGDPEFELWDFKKKSCPKCGTTMVIHPGGAVMHWD